MKAILVVCDGLGDRPVPELGNKTPLEYAKTPNLDRLAKNGTSGLMHTIKKGQVPGSDTAHLAILGYDPYKVYTGRGPFEAAGVGLDVKPGDVAFRVNFASVDEEGIVTDRRAGRIESTKPFEESLNSIKVEGAEIFFRSGTSHRGALVIRAPNLSSAVTGTDPKKEGKPLKICHATDNSSEAEFTCKIVNEYASKALDVLKNHPYNEERIASGKKPGNALLIRGAGLVPHLESFESRFKLKPVVISGAAFYKGICNTMGMSSIEVDGATGGTDSDFSAKISAALDALTEFDFVFVHIKATDNMGHDGDYEGKIKVIEKIDAALEQIKEKNLLFILTGDHSTPCSIKNHSGDPVPILFHGGDLLVDHVETFGERAAMQGGIGHIVGLDVMKIILNLTNHGEKYGA